MTGSERRGDEVAVRRATEHDLPAIIKLGSAALGWEEGAHRERFFRWKHLENPFGTSPMWVAEHDGRMVAYRVMMRWRFLGPDGEPHDVVRAVDTATHPDWQRRGLFRLLTMQAVEELRADGAAFVFNTPNDQSRPGYLKMGWQVAGRPVIGARPRLSGLPKLALLAWRLRSGHVAAEGSVPCEFGEPAAEALLSGQLEGLDVANRRECFATDRTPMYLRWRYSLSDLGYRLVRQGKELADGFAVFRVRARGGVREAVVLDVFLPSDASSAAGGRLLRRVAGQATADVTLCSDSVPSRAARFVHTTRLGPVVTTRSLASAAPAAADEFAFSLGDLELF